MKSAPARKSIVQLAYELMADDERKQKRATKASESRSAPRTAKTTPAKKGKGKSK